MDKYSSVMKQNLADAAGSANTPPVNKKSILSHLTIKMLIPKGKAPLGGRRELRRLSIQSSGPFSLPSGEGFKNAPLSCTDGLTFGRWLGKLRSSPSRDMRPYIIKKKPGYGRAHRVDRRVKNRVSYSLASTLESVNTAEQKAFEVAAKAGFGEDEQYHIAMAVREAAVNAVLHGNGYDPDKKFLVAYEMTLESLVITIADQGSGLDLKCLTDPLAPENLMKQTGRGIFLIRSFMDEVKIRDMHPGTEITLIKHVGHKAANAKEESK
jgi:serine/threonine-protein kinase RsbW